MAIDPMTALVIASAGLNIGNTIFTGKDYRNQLRSQRLQYQLKGAKDYNNTFRAWNDEQALNYAVFSASGASAEWSGSYKAIDEEVERKKTSDLDEITLMTQAMSDELNSRIAASRTSDKFSIATTLVTTGIGLKELSLNKQHKKILEKQLERETKKIKGFTYNKRTGNFTSRRDLFAHNPTSWGMSAWKSEKGSMMWKNRWWKKYGRDLGGNY